LSWGMLLPDWCVFALTFLLLFFLSFSDLVLCFCIVENWWSRSGWLWKVISTILYCCWMSLNMLFLRHSQYYLQRYLMFGYWLTHMQLNFTFGTMRQDPDDTLNHKTLDLWYKMTKSSNAEVIVENMITYMQTSMMPTTRQRLQVKLLSWLSDSLLATSGSYRFCSTQPLECFSMSRSLSIRVSSSMVLKILEVNRG
jgi:hypothetical protein